MWIAKDLEHLRTHHLPAVQQVMREAMEEAVGAGSGLLELFDYQLDVSADDVSSMIPLAVAQGLDADPREAYGFAAALGLLSRAALTQDSLLFKYPMVWGAYSVWRRFGREKAMVLITAMEAAGTQLLARHQRDPELGQMMLAQLMESRGPLASAIFRRLSIDPQTFADPEALIALDDEMLGPMARATLLGAAATCGVSPERVFGMMEATRELGVVFDIATTLSGLYEPGLKIDTLANLKEGRACIQYAHFLAHASPTAVAAARRDLEVLDAPARARILAALEEAGSIRYCLDRVHTIRQATGRALQGEPQMRDLVDALIHHLLRPVKPVVDKWIDGA